MYDFIFISAKINTEFSVFNTVKISLKLPFIWDKIMFITV